MTTTSDPLEVFSLGHLIGQILGVRGSRNYLNRFFLLFVIAIRTLGDPKVNFLEKKIECGRK